MTKDERTADVLGYMKSLGVTVSDLDTRLREQVEATIGRLRQLTVATSILRPETKSLLDDLADDLQAALDGRRDG